MSRTPTTAFSGWWRALRAVGCAAVLLPNVSGAQVPASNGAADNTRSGGVETGGDKRVTEVLGLKFDRSPATVLTAQAKLVGTNLAADSVELFRLRMIAGQWKEAGPFITTLPAESRAQAYEAVLKAVDLAAATAGTGGGPDRSPVLVPEEVADLADMAPAPLTPEQLKQLAAILRRALAAEQSIELLLQRLEKGTKWLGGTDPAKRERAADLIIEMGRARDSLRMLPPLTPGRETASFPLLEKHAKQLAARGRQDQRAEDILESWRLNQILLTAPGVPPPMKERAWRRVADLMRVLPPEKSAETLAQVAKEGPSSAIELLKQVMVQVADDRPNREPANRKLNLLMQWQVAATVVPMAETSESVRYALNQFALTWIDEAAYARRMYVPPRQNTDGVYDRYGNSVPFPEPAQNQNQPRPVGLVDLLDSVPDNAWRNAVDPSLRPRLLAQEADLSLKQDNDSRALPLVEELAPFDAKEAQRLASEFLRVWAKTHNPNRMENAMPTPYYAMQQAPQGVPLTRAAQKRNLTELSAIYARLKAAGVTVERPALLNAFTRAHSNAEVYQGESIELVFGKREEIDAALYADLLQTMRVRLANQWRKPAIQQQAKTQRTDAQIDAEVQKGYQLVVSLATQALDRQPDDWRLTQVGAATEYDWSEFQYSRKVDLAVYMQRRERAFDGFARASVLYGAKLGTTERKDETASIYQQWLNAQLGASDVGQLTRQQDPESQRLLQIRTAILALPGDAAPRHMEAFAKAVSNSIIGIPAQLKSVYLKAALVVIGEDVKATRIRETVAHYAGLLQELELDLRLDGDAEVGHDAPFGAFLALRHTADIERESQGGFAKYLRNDAKQSSYYGGGAPPVDHRDLFEKGIREKLSDRFEVLSISFHDPKLQTYGYGRPGWRETPLAYLLLKPKDPAVDKLPSVQLNMDFADLQGTVILPVASPVILLDAKADAAPPRPLAKLEVIQTLDERALGEGKLTLEVKATGAGLIPKFEEAFDFDSGAFKIEEKTDSGPAVQRLSSDDGAALTAISERTWLIKLAYQPGGDAAAANFRFPQARGQGAKVVYKRYRDADLVEVPPEVALVGLPLGSRWTVPVAWIGGVLVAAVGLVVVLRRQNPRRANAAASRYVAPRDVTPFSTLELLRKMQGDRELGLPEQDRSELAQTIARVESYYFSEQNAATNAPDLARLIGDWLNRPSIRKATA